MYLFSSYLYILTNMKSRVLIVIRDYMKGLTKLKWMGRLLNKHNIEDALAEYSTMLDLCKTNDSPNAAGNRPKI